MSGDIFDRHDWWRDAGRQKPGMLLNILQCTGQPPSTTNHPAPNVSGAEAEKCWCMHK